MNKLQHFIASILVISVSARLLWFVIENVFEQERDAFSSTLV
jgi:hypothetical protein